MEQIIRNMVTQAEQERDYYLIGYASRIAKTLL